MSQQKKLADSKKVKALYLLLQSPSNIYLKNHLHHHLIFFLKCPSLFFIYKACKKTPPLLLLQSFESLLKPLELFLKDLEYPNDLGQSKEIYLEKEVFLNEKQRLSLVWKEGDEELFLMENNPQEVFFSKTFLQQLHSFFNDFVQRELGKKDPYDFFSEEEKKIVLDMLQEKCRLAPWKYTPHENRVYWSKETFKQYNLNENTFLPNASSVANYHTPEEFAAMNTAFFNCLEKHQHFHYYYHLKGSKGSTPSKSLGMPHLKEGKIQSVVGVSMPLDITSDTIPSIQEEITRFELTLQETKLCMWEYLSLDDNLYISSGFFDNFGHKNHQKGKTFLKLLHPEDVKKLSKIFYQNQTTPNNFESTFRLFNQKKQCYHWVQIKGKAYDNEEHQIQRMMGIFVDITDIKNMDQELIDSESTLKELISLTSHPRLNLQEKISAILSLGNKKFSTSYAAVSQYEDNFEKVNILYHKGFSHVNKSITQALKNLTLKQLKEKSQTLYFNKKKSKSQPPFLQISRHLSVPIRIHNKTYGSLHFSSQSPSPKAFSQKDLAFIQLFAQWLSLEIRRIEDEKMLNQQKEKADKANKTKSLFLANMSHEIRNPLNGILGLVQLLSETSLSTHQQFLVENLLKSSFHLKDLVSDILDCEKIEQGQQDIQQKPFNLKKALCEVVQMHYGFSSQKKIGLYLNMPYFTPEKVKGDERRLKQILINLINNAIKFTKKGTVILHVEYLEKAPLPFIFSVEDTGVGIKQQDQEKVFESFQQLDNQTIEHSGTGLGLSIVKKMVSLLKGKIFLKSELGGGSTFSVHLKLQTLEKIASPPLVNINSLAILTKSSTTRTFIKRFLSIFPDHKAIAKHFFTDPLQFKQCRADIKMIHLFSAHIKHRSIIDDLFHLLKEDKQPTILFTDLPLLTENHPLSQLPHIQCIPLPIPAYDFIHFLHKFSTNKRSSPYPIHAHSLASSSPSLPKNPKVLVVEDNDTNLIILNAFLQKLDIHHEIAKNGAEALEKVTSSSYSCILMDCRMPIMDGYQATIKIRQYEKLNEHKPCPIIALTAQVLKEDKERCMAIGMNDFISKPIELKTLKNKLDQHLRC